MNPRTSYEYVWICWGLSYLERLSIPILDLFDRGHFTQTIRELPEVLNTVGKADGEFFGEELRGAKEGSYIDDDSMVS